MITITHKKRILVVDDNKDLADVTVKLLHALGQEAQAAYDGRSALATLEDYSPDILFLDIAMPTMDGCEVAERIRSRAREKHITLVAVTGFSQPEYVRRIRNAGFDYHVIKPAGMDTFRKIISGEFRPLQG